MDDTAIIATRKPYKQPRRSQDHAAVTPAKTARFIDEEHTDQNGEIKNGILKELLGGKSPSKFTNLQTKLDCFRTLLSQLEAQEIIASLTVEEWKEIHGFVALHLGNTETEELNSGEGNSIELVSILCRSFVEIYRFTMPSKMFALHELQVVFSVIVQQANNLALTPHKATIYPKNTKTATYKNDSVDGLASAILEVIRLLLSCHTPKVESIELLYVFLARLVFHDSLDATIKNNVDAFMREMAYSTHIPQVSKGASWALAAMATIHQKTDIHLKHQSTSTGDALLFWRCLAQSTEGAIRLSQSQHTLNYLVSLSVRSADFGMAKRSVECLSDISLHRKLNDADTSTVDRTQEALLHVLMNAPNIYIQQCTIPGINQCPVEKMAWDDAVLIQKVFSTIMKIICLKTPDGGEAVIRASYKYGAATVVASMIEHVLEKGHQESSPNPIISYQQIMHYIACLLEDDCDSIVNLAVELLSQEVHRDKAKIVMQPSMEALSQLAIVCCNPLVSIPMKRRAVEIFEVMTRSEETLGVLARQEKVLEAVVAMASSPSSDTNNHDTDRIKNLALIVLMRLSKDVCNRRILAKQVGVLACMIRYARSLSEQQTQQNEHSEIAEPSVRLLDLKQNIMDLAIAL